MSSILQGKWKNIVGAYIAINQYSIINGVRTDDGQPNVDMYLLFNENYSFEMIILDSKQSGTYEVDKDNISYFVKDDEGKIWF